MNTEPAGSLRVALRWLAHPVSLAAIGVMVLNDHVLKHAYGIWWTGKLSDVAGLVFFPAVVAVAFAAIRGARDVTGQAQIGFERLALTAVAITAVGFVWVKATAVGAAAASAVLSAITGPLFGGPSVVRADATDLLALPALGLAVWVAFSEKKRGRARRAFAVAALPLALLASVATGPADDPSANVVVDNNGDAQAYVSGVEEFNHAVRFSYVNGGWHGETSDTVRAEDYGYGIPIPNQTEDCVPSEPSVCFRVLEGTTGVERSDDAGATWRADWQLTREQVAQLEDAYGKASYDFATTGVGVVATDRGYVVIAGNGTDGFAVRGEDGTWTRVGFAGMSCCAWAKTADFETVESLPEVHAFPVWLLLGVGLSTLALPLVGIALRRRHEHAVPVRVPAWAWVLYGFGAFFGFIIIGANSNYGPLTRSPIAFDAFMVAPGGAVVLVLILSVAASAGLFRPWRQAATCWGWLLGAVAAGAASALVPKGIWLQLAAAVVALAVAYAAYVPWARRTLVGRPRRARTAGAPAWTLDDASILTGIGASGAPMPLPQVFAQGGYPEGAYPALPQLAVSLRRLTGAGLIRFHGIGWFKSTGAGQVLLRHAGRGTGDDATQRRDAVLATLGEFPCREIAVHIGQEEYDAAVWMYLGAAGGGAGPAGGAAPQA